MPMPRCSECGADMVMVDHDREKFRFGYRCRICHTLAEHNERIEKLETAATKESTTATETEL